MKWVTRKRIKLDRSACIWLILRHIDPQAQIEYVESKDLPKAIEGGALPFHNTVSEEPGMRERTSFQELLAEYKLDAPTRRAASRQAFWKLPICSASSGCPERAAAVCSA